ncbi:hypothetical protein WJX73_009408 [Symbiochloris irregularis]|uniref:ABC transporter domain-containing protein n=1 Tax=Symbiochloris irregularis TaxID=706552 RepID=A0AAW1NSI5_9CHLO
MLGYAVDGIGACPVALHPLHGASIYPGTVFTNAPPHKLWQAIRTVQGQDGRQHPSRASCLDSHLVHLSNLSIATAAGVPVVSGLDLKLNWGQRLLIEGVSGCGKSTFVRALSGLGPCSMTRERWPSPSQVAVIAQAPLVAPGPSLREQVTYPDTSSDAISSERLSWLLTAVQLQHLLDRVQSSWDAPFDWAGTLSAGEIQRLQFARVDASSGTGNLTMH